MSNSNQPDNWKTTALNRHDDLTSGKISAEEYIITQLGYEIENYAGEIPSSEFLLDTKSSPTIDTNTVGSHNQIYVEPNLPICYKTGINGIVPPIDNKNITYPMENSLPGHLHEGLFLEKIDKYNLPCIPKFYGFVKLPDGRISVAQQFIPNTLNIPVQYETHNGQDGMKEMSSKTIYSLFTKLEEVAYTIDEIQRLGGSINDTEIRGNMRLEMNDEIVEKIWIIDFEGYTPPLNLPPKESQQIYPPKLAITIHTLLQEAIRSRPNNTTRSSDHVAMDYMNFVLQYTVQDNRWDKPKTTIDMVKQVNEILREHPLEEFQEIKYERPPTITIPAQSEFILD